MKWDLMRKTGLKILFALLSFNLMIYASAQTSKTRISAEEFYKKIKSSKEALIIDTRPAFKYDENRIHNAVLAEGQNDLIRITKGIPKSKTIFLYCQIGDRSKKAIKVLKAEGFSSVFELKDGLVTWIDEGLPLDTDPL